jgi:lipopolysaccharide/colanic/teichoic acid biosynthesis glycosyltransferase
LGLKSSEELATVGLRRSGNEEVQESMLYDFAEASSVPHGSMRTVFDRALAALILVIISIPLLIVAALTWAAVGSPILFRQVRSGLAGRPFEIIKFRTMFDTVDAAGALLPDSHRTNLATRFLRRTRLDELPQLVSVLRGQMAIVGPRPLWPETIREMGRWGVHRGSIRPGLTGWSQVNGGPFLSNEEKLALDIWYVDHRSPWLDLSIVARTIAILVLGDRINRKNVGEAQSYLRSLAHPGE